MPPLIRQVVLRAQHVGADLHTVGPEGLAGLVARPLHQRPEAVQHVLARRRVQPAGQAARIPHLARVVYHAQAVPRRAAKHASDGALVALRAQLHGAHRTVHKPLIGRAAYRGVAQVHHGAGRFDVLRGGHGFGNFVAQVRLGIHKAVVGLHGRVRRLSQQLFQLFQTFPGFRRELPF